MRRLHLQLEGGLQALVFVLVVAVAFAGSHISPWNFSYARGMRWIALAELGAIACALLVLPPRPRVRATPPLTGGALLVALGVASAAWAADASFSFARALSFGLLLAVAWAVAAVSEGRPELVGRILLAVLAAVVLITIAGVVELFHSYDQAVVPATRGQGARYSGIGNNPNQIAMLLALALPLALWGLAEVRRRAARAAFAVLTAAFAVSLVASGSRGAIVGGFAAALAYLLIAYPRRRLALTAVATAVFVAAMLATTLPPRARTEPVLNPAFGVTPQLSRFDVNAGLPLESEFGFPGENAPAGHRKLFFTSGRLQAWQGAVEQAAKRPLLGYGWGMEDRAFVDRYYLFVSSRVENSYLGLVLQLGPLGPALLLAAIASVLLAWKRRARRLAGDGARVAAVCGGIVLGGVVLGVPQSYLTSVGSPATAPFWFALFLLGALVCADGGERDQRQEDAAQRHPESRLDVVRGEHDGVRGEQHDRSAAGSTAPKREH
jgi:O-antigen ligase